MVHIDQRVPSGVPMPVAEKSRNQVIGQHTNASPRRILDWQGMAPMTLVSIRMLSAECGLSPNARLVALAIAKRMGPDRDGKERAFMGQEDIAARTGLSVKTVARCMKELHGDPSGVFLMERGGTTRGHRHRCYRFELIRNSAAHAESRKAGRERERARRERTGLIARIRAATLELLKFREQGVIGATDSHLDIESRLGATGGSLSRLRSLGVRIALQLCEARGTLRSGEGPTLSLLADRVAGGSRLAYNDLPPRVMSFGSDIETVLKGQPLAAKTVVGQTVAQILTGKRPRVYSNSTGQYLR
jgi:hypothetical protein